MTKTSWGKTNNNLGPQNLARHKWTLARVPRLRFDLSSAGENEMGIAPDTGGVGGAPGGTGVLPVRVAQRQDARTTMMW